MRAVRKSLKNDNEIITAAAEKAALFLYGRIRYEQIKCFGTK